MWKLLSAALAIIGVTGGAPAPAAAQTPINISYQPSLYWALPYYIATEKGWWKDLGLTPGFSVFPAGAPQVAAAQAKSWDVGGTGSVPAVLGAARSGLLTIGITNDESKVNVLMVRGEKFDAFKANPQSLKQLRSRSEAHAVRPGWHRRLRRTFGGRAHRRRERRPGDRRRRPRRAGRARARKPGVALYHLSHPGRRRDAASAGVD